MADSDSDCVTMICPAAIAAVDSETSSTASGDFYPSASENNEVAGGRQLFYGAPLDELYSRLVPFIRYRHLTWSCYLNSKSDAADIMALIVINT
jgi:hypothetical protein